MTQALRVAMHVPPAICNAGDIVEVRYPGASPGAANGTEWNTKADPSPVPWANATDLLAGTATELAIDPATYSTMLRPAPTTPANDAGRIPVLNASGKLPAGFVTGTLDGVYLDGGTF